MQCGRFGKELQILLKHPQHSINISNRIVDVKGDANTVVTAGEYDIFFGLSDARRVAFPNSVNAGSGMAGAKSAALEGRASGAISNGTIAGGGAHGHWERS